MDDVIPVQIVWALIAPVLTDVATDCTQKEGQTLKTFDVTDDIGASIQYITFCEETRNQFGIRLMQQKSAGRRGRSASHTAWCSGYGEVCDTTHHSGIRMWIKNKLQMRFARDDITLDQEWAGLIEAAGRRYVGGEG